MRLRGALAIELGGPRRATIPMRSKGIIESAFATRMMCF
jgi:hypothetical protein